MKTNKTILIGLLCLGLFACKDDKDDSVPAGVTVTPNEEESITTVELIFSDTLNNPLDTFRFQDADGDGGLAPVIDSIKLQGNSAYVVEARFLDESDPNDVEDITVEILEEDDEHLVCYTPVGLTGFNIMITDTDGAYPIGLKSRWTTNPNGTTTQGALMLVLKHQPGSKDGTCGPGSSDIEISFPCDC